MAGTGEACEDSVQVHGHGLGQVLLPVELDPLPFPLGSSSLDIGQFGLQPFLLLDIGEQSQRAGFQLGGFIQRRLVVVRALVSHQSDVRSEQEGGFEVGAIGVEFAEVGQDPIGFARVALFEVRGCGEHQGVICEVSGGVIQPDGLQCQQGLALGVEERPGAVREVGDQGQPGKPAGGSPLGRGRCRSGGTGRADLGGRFEVLSIEPIATDFEEPLAGTIDVPGRREVDHQLGVVLLCRGVLLLVEPTLGQLEQRFLAESRPGVQQVGVGCITDAAVVVEFLEEGRAGPFREVEEPGCSLALEIDQ